MQQVLTACLAVVGLAFTGAKAGFAADMAVPPLITPAAALMAVLKRCRELCLAAAYALALTGVVGAADLGGKAEKGFGRCLTFLQNTDPDFAPPLRCEGKFVNLSAAILVAFALVEDGIVCAGRARRRRRLGVSARNLMRFS
jgi:hypothetical protein